MKKLAILCAALFAGAAAMPLFGCNAREKETVLRVCSWEEYIDLGGWEEDELIEVGDGIIGVNSMVDDFTEWYNSTHENKVRVEYSTFGTNEDLYNRLKLGDVYDLVCPSDYMIMKLVDEEAYTEFSKEFWNENNEENYYARNVSRYIDGKEDSVFNEHGWHGIAACYMWGTTGDRKSVV